MPLIIATQFGTSVPYAAVTGWAGRAHGPMYILSAENAKGSRRDVLIAHTLSELDTALDLLEAEHEKSGDEVVRIAARDAVIAVRLAARKAMRASNGN